jgi:hypothetical protein
MTLPDWLDEALTLSLRLSQWQQFGLAFLLGSFVVATWSDLKYLAAQREFLEVWLFFLGGVAIHDTWAAHAGHAGVVITSLKWALIALLSLLSLRAVGVLFRLAPGDVAALAAAASLLPPLLVVVFFGAARGFAWALGPMLARGRAFYPFMPVVSLATATVLALGWLMR